MSTLENLFMQIFDRRTWIVDHQLKPQRQSYDQSLASNLLINGIRPPSWLWTSTRVGPDAERADPGELKKEELISGLLFPPPRPPSIPLSAGQHAVYSRCTSKRDNRQLSVSSAAETCDSNQCIDAVDRSMAEPNRSSNGYELHHHCVSDEVRGMDHISISHQVQTVAETSKILSEAFLLRPIPNSSFNDNVVGQSILNEVHMINPISASPVRMDAESSMTYFKQDQLQPKMPFNDSELGQKCTLSGVSEPNNISTSPQIQMDAKLTETVSQIDRSFLKFQRSRSRQKAIENRNSAKAKTKRHSFRENIAAEYSGKVKRSRSSQQPNCNKGSLELKNSSDIAKEYDDGTTLPGSSGQLCHDDGLINPEEPSSQAGEDEGQKEACGNVDILSDYAGNKAIQSLDGANKHYQQACTTEIAETEFVSGAPYAIQSVCSESKMGSTNNEVGLESVLSRPTTDNDTFIEPKQLVFDHIEDYGVKPAINKQVTSLEVRAVGKLAAFQSSKEVSETMDFQICNGIFADQLMQCKELLQANELVKEKEIVQADEFVLEKVLQKIEIMNGEKEAEKVLVAGEGDTNLLVLDTEEADYSVSHGFPPCKTSDLTSLSFMKRKPLCTGTVSGNALGSQSTMSNGMPINHAKVGVSSLQEGGGKNPLRSQLSEAVGFKQPELASKLLPAQSSEEFPVTIYLQEVNNAHSVVHDADLSLMDKLVQEKEAPQSANFMHDKEDPQDIEIMTREEQDQEALNEDQEERLQIPLSQEAKCNAFHESFSCTPAHLSTSPKKTMSTSNEKVCGGASADISPARNEISDYKAHIGIHDESYSWEDGGKNSQRSELSSAVDFHLPVAPIHAQAVSVADLKCTTEPDVEPDKTLLECCGVEGAANDVPMTSASIEFSHNSMKPGTHLEASDGVSSVAMDSGSSVFKLSTASKRRGILGQQGRYFLRSSNSYSRDLQFSKSNRSHALRKSGRLSKPVHTSCETLWPTYKGRQIECQSDIVNTSMRTRRSVLFLQQQDTFCKQSKSSVDASHVIQDFVEQPNVTTENHAAEKHQRKKRRVVTVSPELHLPYSTLNADEVDIETKGKDQSEMVPMESKDIHDRGVRRSAVGDSTSHLEDLGKITKPTTLCDAENRSISSDALGESVRHESSEISDFARGTTEKLKSILGQHGYFPSSGSSSDYKCPDVLGSDKALQELEGIGGLLRQEGKQVPDSTEKTMEEVKAALGESSLSSCYSARSSYYENLDLLGDDKTMTEAGVSGFSGPPDNLLTFAVCKRFDFHNLHYSVITKERVTGSEQLDKHCSVLTPVDYSTNHRILTLPEVCQSVPNGLLEHVELRKACPFCWNDPKPSNESQDNNEAERCGYAIGRSFSDFIPSSQCGCGSKRSAYSPPPGKLCWSSSLEKQANQNPELICFRIDEDSCMNEDNGHLEEAVDYFQKRSSRKGTIHVTKEALSDVSSKYQNSPQVVSTSKKFPDKGSLDSMSVETYLFEMQKGGKKNLENSHGNPRKFQNEGKENQSLSIVGNGGMALENHHNRFSRSKLSRKASRKKGSQAFSEKRCKPTNIVSNISSFLPLVQHKQEMATAKAGKRDIKVKALEAAEAAKRLEEKREKQRQIRKEAAKLERAKLENVRQLELKKKEEERKKKEEEMAVRKRVREEEERKEKERKRKCIEEARRQQKEREEKLRAEKEEKELRRKVDEEHKRELAEEARKQQKKEKGKGGAGCTKKLEAEVKPANDVMGNASHGSNSQEYPDVVKEPQPIRKVVNNSGNSLKLTEEHVSVVGECEVSESYAISPYQGSDNEEDDDDDDDVNISQKKFMPLWARGKCLAQSLLSLKHIDPSTIFLRERCSRLSEVLLPRKQKQ